MIQDEAEIAIAQEQLRLAEANVENQKLHIAELMAKGRSTLLADELLDIFERTLKQRREYLEYLLGQQRGTGTD